MQSYLIGLWFSLRTHASQIWQNPQQLLHPMEVPVQPGHQRFSLYQRLRPGVSSAHASQRAGSSLRHKPSIVTTADSASTSRSETPHEPSTSTYLGPQHAQQLSTESAPAPVPVVPRRISYADPPVAHTQVYTPIFESVDHAIKDSGMRPPENMSPDDFTRAVAVATVSALRHQHMSRSPARPRGVVTSADVEAAAGHGGHDAPSWSRTTSASVLLACTALYALIAGTFACLVYFMKLAHDERRAFGLCCRCCP